MEHKAVSGVLNNFEILQASITAKYHIQVMLLFFCNGRLEIYSNAQKTSICYSWKKKHMLCIPNNLFTSMKKKKGPTVFCKTITNHRRQTTWNSSVKEILKSVLQSLQWWSETTDEDKVRASFSQCLIAALLKTPNASTIVHCHLTTIKVVDYCLANWSHSLVVLHGQTTLTFPNFSKESRVTIVQFS